MTLLLRHISAGYILGIVVFVTMAVFVMTIIVCPHHHYSPSWYIPDGMLLTHRSLVNKPRTVKCYSKCNPFHSMILILKNRLQNVSHFQDSVTILLHVSAGITMPQEIIFKIKLYLSYHWLCFNQCHISDGYHFEYEQDKYIWFCHVWYTTHEDLFGFFCLFTLHMFYTKSITQCLL